MIEKRLLQIVVAIACLVPLSVGGTSVLHGPGFLGHAPVIPCIPNIEVKGPRFRLLGTMVVCGGLARVVSLLAVGAPSKGHVFGLAMELGIVPLLMLWQAAFARRYGAASTSGPASTVGR